ncbi:GNAT family N-acetyltransferase [Actinoplanes sp. NPDC026623]|uniref:GNAT family N-acetyltransferase n=1 Tax=Actinoplanes sp. NPDC026623 TaxID=3155610 RepID=UPI0033D3BD2D
MATTTRPAGPADAADLHELAARTFGLANPPGTPQSDIDAFIAQHLSLSSFDKYLADPDRILLLAHDDGAPVAYCMLVAGPIADPELARTVAAAGPGPAVELSKFYVAASSHGSGVAGTLMAATLDAAAATGARQCWLGVNQRNARAAKFYARHGFEIIGTKRFLVGEQRHDDHVRARPL